MSWRLWLQSYNGQRFLQITAFASTCGTFAAYFLPSTVFIDRYKNFVQSYEKGLGQPVPENVTKLYERVLKDLKIREYEKEYLQLFTVYGFDLFTAGSILVQSGAIIGVPISFSYESVKDVNRNIKVVDKSIDWSSDAGIQLQESLVLSEKARMFGLARELCTAASPGIWFFSGYPSAAIFLTYVTSRSINAKFNMRGHPFRYIMYTLVATFMGTLSMTLTDITTAYLENSHDEQAARVSPDYAEGGREFYQKLLRRNQALRALMQENGEKIYSVSGNQEMFIRMKHAPLTDRLRNIEAIISENKAEAV